MNILLNDAYLQGEAIIPASKSYLHRALIAASLSSTRSEIKNFTLSNDILDTIQVLRELGTVIEIGETIQITPKKWHNNPMTIKESGTTYRLMIPILSVYYNKFFISTDKGLYKRPLSEYEKLGLVRKNGVHEFSIEPGTFYLDGSVSSQFISGLLYTLPLLDGDSIIVVNNMTSRNYILMTLEVLKAFSIGIRMVGDTFYIEGNQTYKGCTFEVEPDFSSLAYMAVAGILNGDIMIKAPKRSIQPDFEIIKILEDIAHIEYDGKYRFKKQVVRAFDIDIDQHPDLAPALAALSMAADGKCILRNVKRLKYKESNRIEGLLKLQNFGINVLYNDTIQLIPSIMSDGSIKQNDHRIAMMAAVLPVHKRIINAESINKSYPGFIDELKKLGSTVMIDE